ncbi:MAG: type II toxin-antitoxin system HipA family toxin [Bacteroides sp.]|nr:type II toxin-antitoxin system HipA family toxin [Bacteroides sp.]MCM1458067.1 type II toxin-antitoxin system HipA family toxin [Lachnoclostridium sp.]
MVDIAKVKLYGNDLGTFRWDERYAVAQFEYADSFVGCGIEPAPIMMPVREGRVYSFGDIGKETFRGLPGMLADSLPDTYGRALFDRWLALTGRQSGNSIETLCFLGKRCMGALEFEPAIDLPYNSNTKIEIDALVNVASEALAEKKDFGANLSDDKKAAIAEIVRLGTSAGGQRAKAIIAYNKTTGEVLSGQVDAPAGFDYYLIKLDGVTAEAGFRETQNFGRLEYSFYRLVKECGIEMSECSLIEENGRAHFLTKRFDRVNGEKVHMQTLCAVAHYDYRLLRAYSYEQALNVMRILRLPYSQAQEMFRRIVFNVLVRNQDDHTKNISFLMDKNGKWRLSPAYDMGFSYNPDGGWTSQHQMSINGKFDGITRSDLLEIAKRNNIKEAAEIIDQISTVAFGWGSIARECGVPDKMIDAIMPQFQFMH